MAENRRFMNFFSLSGIFLYFRFGIMIELQSLGSGIPVFLANCVLLFEFGLKSILKNQSFLKFFGETSLKQKGCVNLI